MKHYKQTKFDTKVGEDNSKNVFYFRKVAGKEKKSTE